MKVCITIEVNEALEEQGVLEHLEMLLEDEYRGIVYTWEDVEDDE